MIYFVLRLMRSWLWLTNRKCKFYRNKTCSYVVRDGYTCNHEREARHFCGKYRENQFAEYKCKMEKFQRKNR